MTGMSTISARSRRFPAAALAALLAAGLALPAPARAEGGGFGGEFDLLVGGVLVLELSIRGEIGLTGYRVDARAETAGMVSNLYDAGLEAKSTGRIGSGALVPARFEARTRNSEKRQTVEVTWDGDRPVVAAEPAFDPKPWEIEPSEQRGAFDPLTAIATAFVPLPREALCDRTVDISDGRRRYAVDLERPEAPSASGEIACEATYRRVAGFKPKWMERMPEWPFRVFFAETSPGSWEVIRAEGKTSFGMAVLRRRG